MPAAVFSLYTLSQAPILFDGIYEQGIVYGAHLAAQDLKKGTKVKFTVSWDPKSLPRHLDIRIAETNAPAVFSSLRANSSEGAVDVTVSFDPELTVDAARTAATALSLIDSPKIKLNGYAKGNLFYKAFLPLASWSNRTDRLVQPFELTITKDAETLVFIEEDWSVEGDDPKLTLKTIPFSDATNHPKTDTCFIYTQGDCKLARVFSAMEKLKGSSIRTWYIFTGSNP